MKICFTAQGKDMSDGLDPRFGRCKYFIIVNSENDEYEVLENEGGMSAHGAGVAAAQQIVNEGVQVVVTGNIGPNANNIISTANINVYKGINDSVKSNLDLYKQNKLVELNQISKPHSGMKR